MLAAIRNFIEKQKRQKAVERECNLMIERLKYTTFDLSGVHIALIGYDNRCNELKDLFIFKQQSNVVCFEGMNLYCSFEMSRAVFEINGHEEIFPASFFEPSHNVVEWKKSLSVNEKIQDAIKMCFAKEIKRFAQYEIEINENVLSSIDSLGRVEV